MEAVGLMPSSTGKPGGARTGQKMNDYPIAGGPFEKACKSLMAKRFKLSWYDRAGDLVKLSGGLSADGGGEGGEGADKPSRSGRRVKIHLSRVRGPCMGQGDARADLRSMPQRIRKRRRGVARQCVGTQVRMNRLRENERRRHPRYGHKNSHFRPENTPVHAGGRHS